MIRCAITGLQRYGRGTGDPWRQQLDLVRSWIVDEIELIQVREKHLDGACLCAFTERVVQLARGSATKVLVNGRLDVALACQTQGVHLPSAGSLRSDQVRFGFTHAGLAPPIVSVSCHTLAEIEHAVLANADLILFGPVIEKRVGSERVTEGVGLEGLGVAVRAAGQVPVLALGGLTPEAIGPCLAAGAAGVAGIRLFG